MPVKYAINFISAQYISYGKVKSAMVLIGERAKRARHYQGGTNLSWCGTYIYMYLGT